MTPPLATNDVNDNEFVPRREGIRLFTAAGLSSSTFDREARKNIKTLPPANGERGKRYSLPDIQNVLQRRRKTNGKVEIPPIHFRRMTVEDMPASAIVLTEVFDGSPDIPQWQDRIRANEEIGYVVTSGDEIVGCGFIMPHTEEKILDIFAHEATPMTYPHEILPYDPGVPTYLYFRSVAVRQEGIPKELKRAWAKVLIIGLLKVIVNLGTRGIVIQRIYARSDTFQGERMLHRLGFTRIVTTTCHENFFIEVETSGLTFMKQYKKALAKWQKKREV